ncbi:hypothetical protein AQ919_25740 [Burkholderia pseudomallei]|nr:hypothetical protein AQ862_00795 [Burkholderia pseudomallei]ONC51388.1 hypothetical protein AQ919_25740 [Burkholderia pseudomallei]RAQ84062.1 hypothetical protein A4G85_11970 [Burkholderia pseudomallei]
MIDECLGTISVAAELLLIRTLGGRNGVVCLTEKRLSVSQIGVPLSTNVLSWGRLPCKSATDTSK